MLKANKFSIVFFSWMLLVTWASLTTFPEEEAQRINIPNFDKMVHFCFYFGAAVLGTLFVREVWQTKVPLVKTLVFVVIGAAIFGIIIEFAQFYFTTDRQGDVLDAMANTCGAIGGALTMKALFSDKRGLKWK